MKISSLLPTRYSLLPIFKIGTHAFWAQRTDENPSSPTPYSLLPIFKIDATEKDPPNPPYQGGNKNYIFSPL